MYQNSISLQFIYSEEIHKRKTLTITVPLVLEGDKRAGILGGEATRTTKYSFSLSSKM